MADAATNVIAFPAPALTLLCSTHVDTPVSVTLEAVKRLAKRQKAPRKVMAFIAGCKPTPAERKDIADMCKCFARVVVIRRCNPIRNFLQDLPVWPDGWVRYVGETASVPALPTIPTIAVEA